ncbi:hypothetical protein [Stenotrophomonas phage BUCTxx100]|nr:hypothetical protein [Stenotrophomonas phage BUCTxx100]
MFNNKILVIKSDFDIVTQYRTVKRNKGHHIYAHELVGLEEVKQRVGDENLLNSIVIFIRNDVFFVFMMGAVHYGLVHDVDHLTDHILKIRESIIGNKDLRHRSILHLAGEGFGNYFIIPTVDPVAHKALNDFLNNRLF